MNLADFLPCAASGSAGMTLGAFGRADGKTLAHFIVIYTNVFF